MVMVEVNGTGCDGRAPSSILGLNDPGLGVVLGGHPLAHIWYEGWIDNFFPTHDPCGNNDFDGVADRSSDPRGAIYIR